MTARVVKSKGSCEQSAYFMTDPKMTMTSRPIKTRRFRNQLCKLVSAGQAA